MFIISFYQHHLRAKISSGLRTGRLPDLLILLLVITAISCKSVGPKSVIRDRNAYVNAISDSWKSQMMLNIIKIRYADAPVFLNVASIINQYEISGQVSANAYYEQKGVGWAPTIGAQGNYIDRPTITYSPLTGQKFASDNMKPLPPSIILGLVFTGFPVDLMLRITLSSLNGYMNSYGGYMRYHEASPEFYLMIEDLWKLQKTNGLNLYLEKAGTPQERVILETGVNPDTNVIAIVKHFNSIKSLPVGTRKSGSGSSDSIEIIMTTRSLLEILGAVSSMVEVPEEHVEAKYTYPTPEFRMPNGMVEKPIINIRCSKDQPPIAYISVLYNGYWFYIDMGDFKSKQAFSNLLLLSSLCEASDPKSMPIITIPTR